MNDAWSQHLWGLSAENTEADGGDGWPRSGDSPADYRPLGLATGVPHPNRPPL